MVKSKEQLTDRNKAQNVIGFCEFMRMGSFQWRGQRSIAKATFFLLFGTPDVHTRLRSAYVLNEIERLDMPVGAKVVEGGFGRGIVLLGLAKRHPDWHLIGFELDPIMAESARRIVERGKRVTNVVIVEGAIEELDASNSYDLIILVDVLEHINDDVRLIKGLIRALRPGGYLVLHVPKPRHEHWRFLPVFRSHDVQDILRSGEGVRQTRICGHVREGYGYEDLCQLADTVGARIVNLQETIGVWGEVSFELNQIFWKHPILRYLWALFTYPIAVIIGYLEILSNPSSGNSFLVTLQKTQPEKGFISGNI